MSEWIHNGRLRVGTLLPPAKAMDGEDLVIALVFFLEEDVGLLLRKSPLRCQRHRAEIEIVSVGVRMRKKSGTMPRCISDVSRMPQSRQLRTDEFQMSRRVPACIIPARQLDESEAVSIADSNTP